MGQVESNNHSLLLDTAEMTQRSVSIQFRIHQLTFWMTAAGILVAELEVPTLVPGVFMLWLELTALSWVARLFLFTIVHRASRDALARSTLLRLFPLVIVSISCAYWVWTVELFSEPQISIKTIFLCIGFLNTTIAMTGMWYAAPIAVVIYNITLWGALSNVLYDNGQATIPELLVLNGTVIVILWIFVVAKSNEIRSQSRRANQLAELSDNLRASNTALEQMKTAALSDLEARSGFFAEATHDFKQRLHGAKMVVLTARSQLLQHKNPLDCVDRLGEEVDALESYIVTLLNFARQESTDSKPHLKSIALQAVFQALDVQFEAEAAETRTKLQIRPTRIKLATNVFMLERMLSNLISNALHYTRGAVLVAARRQRGGVSIEIWDQGPGIAEASRERVFEPFQQVAAGGAKNAHQGVGLGLAVVARLSRQLNYKLSLGSRVGSGTVVRIWIPGDCVVNRE